MTTAKLTNYRQSPRKVRMVADAIRGKSVSEALRNLPLLSKRASGPLEKLLKSAVANATHNHQMDVTTLFIKEIRVDAGTVLKRSLPRARGSASPIHKRSSHVMITLAEKEVKTKKPKKITK